MDALSPVQRSSITFLDTQFEIRQQIYHYCLVRRSPIVVNHLDWDEWQFSPWGINDKVKSLLLLSKEVFQEASDVLYSSNIFQVILHGDGGYCLTKKFTKSNRLKIRKLRIVLRPMGCFYALGKMLDTGLWPPILTGLTTLSMWLSNLCSRRHIGTHLPSGRI
jgi:hypothetical protein